MLANYVESQIIGVFGVYNVSLVGGGGCWGSCIPVENVVWQKIGCYLKVQTTMYKIIEKFRVENVK